MRSTRFLATALIVLSLGVLVGGCPATTNVLQSVPNPITNVDIYRVKNVYAATLELSVKWRAYCYEVSYAQILADPIRKPVCKDRRKIVRQIQRYQPLAGKAVRKADEFVRANPTVNAASIVGPAWDAVVAFQSVVPKVN